VFLHVTAMAQNLYVLAAVVVFVTIPMVDFKTRLRPIMLTPIALPSGFNQLLRLFRRQTVIAGIRVASQNFLPFRLTTIISPPRLDLLCHIRTLATLQVGLRFALRRL